VLFEPPPDYGAYLDTPEGLAIVLVTHISILDNARTSAIIAVTLDMYIGRDICTSRLACLRQ